jgi:hypothetical protein
MSRKVSALPPLDWDALSLGGGRVPPCFLCGGVIWTTQETMRDGRHVWDTFCLECDADFNHALTISIRRRVRANHAKEGAA